MTKSRILIIIGVALLAAVAIFGLARKTEVASQPLYRVYPTSNFAGDSGIRVPMYASRPPVRTIEESSPPKVQTYIDPPSRRRTGIVKKRKTKHSAAIVAGSAGVGAAIGALAGGGQGVAIGALSGGAGGFVYDRLTHKRRVDQD